MSTRTDVINVVEPLQWSSGLEVIKLEFILKRKIKCNDLLLADTCPQVANHCALFVFETVLKFYNLEAWLLRNWQI